MSEQAIKLFRIIPGPIDRSGVGELGVALVQFVDEAGNPVDIGGGGGGEAAPITAESITDASTVGRGVLTAANQAAARTAIGAGTGNGTSSLAVATTAPAALAAAAAVGTGTTAARADHVHAFPTAANVGAPTTAQYTALEARVTALEAV